MKKLFIFVLAFIFNVSHTFATETGSTIGIIEDKFFKLTNSAISIRTIIPHDDHYMVVVDASTEYENKTTSIRPFFSKSWVHDDDKLFSQEQVLVTVMCGDKVIEKKQTLDVKFPYVFIKSIEENNGILTVQHAVTVYNISEYERCDKSTFRLKGKAIHDLTLKEEKIVAPQISICQKEWSIISQWQKKLRHYRTVYTAEDVYQITSKTLYNHSGYLATPEEISRVFVRKELKVHHIDPDVPECGSVGRQIPASTFIVG